MVVQVDNARKLKEQLEAAGKGLRPIYGNLVDRVWGSDRPAAPSAPLRVHALEHAGQSVSDKLTAVRAKMKGESRMHHAWLCTSDMSCYLSFLCLWREAATSIADQVQSGLLLGSCIMTDGLCQRKFMTKLF